MGGADLVIVSNRGPLSFSLDDGEQLVARRGAGGLVSSLSPLVAGTDTIWIAAAMGEHDRAAAERGLMEIEGFRLQSLALDPDRYRMAYDVVSNATLWFLHHGLFDLARRPRLDRRWLDAWTAYQQVNTAFADAVVETAPEGATVLVQDYHLALVGAVLARGRVVSSEESDRWGGWLTSLLGDRQMVLRVDRVELSKNVLRGFLAFDELLAAHPDLRERVTFVALVYASRQGLPEYLAYRTEVEHLATQVNHRWATPGWQPIVLDIADNYTRSVAALRRYDVLLVNPLRDGLNLVAKEGPIVNTNDGLLALSREAGAWAELSEAALEVNPFDVAGTADVLATALPRRSAERAERSGAFGGAAGRRSRR